MYGRVDVEDYTNAVATMENFIPMPTGGAFSRTGFRYVAEVKHSDKNTILLTFEFSKVQVYCIEIGDLYMRFYKDGGQILKTTGDTSDWATGTGYVVGNYVKNAGTIYYCIVAHTSGTFATDLTAGKWVAQDIYEIPTTYTAAEVFDMQFAQNADTLYIAHINHAPAKLTRTSHIAWTLSTISFTGGPYEDDGITPAWNNSDKLYPSCVQFYEQRLAWASNYAHPQTVWLSVSQSYEDMTVETDVTSPTIASSALIYTIATEDVNAINFMSSGKVLMLGTAGGPFSLSSGSQNDALTPMNVKVNKESTYGCAPILPIRVGNSLLYVQRDYRTVREVQFSIIVDAYEAVDVTIKADHITYSGLVEADYQQAPINIGWFVREDGEMIGLTREVQQKVIGWHRHTTDGDFKSVAVLPAGESDETWAIIERQINGSTKQYVEYMIFEEQDEQEDCFYVDSGLSYNGKDEGIEIESATAANPVVITTVASHGLSDGDVVRLRGIVGMTELNNRKFTVANKTADTFELQGEDGSAYEAYESGGTVRECTDTITGLSHLEGKEVVILADGAPHPNRTVASGSITLDDDYSEVHVGLQYIPQLKLLNIEGYTRVGSAIGVVRRIIKTTLMLYKSLGFSVGLSGAEDITFYRVPSDIMNNYVPLFTGEKSFPFPGGWGKSRQMVVLQEQPLPCNVIAAVNLCHIGDEG